MQNAQALRDLAAALAAELSPAELRAIVAEARAEALGELRARLKEALLGELLARAAQESRGERRDDDRPIAPEPRTASEDNAARAAIAAELAALRAQLSANRTFLGDAPDDADPGDQRAPAPAAPHAVVLEAPHPAPEPPAPSSQPATLLYVYGVMPAGVALPEIAGLAGATLQALPCGDLCAMVSPVPAAEFSEAALEAQIHDPLWLERMARAHEAAQRALLSRGTLVPMRFATIYTGPERVAAMLREQADELREALGRLAEHSEWGVKLWVNQQALAEGVSQASPALRELQAQIAARPTGAAYMLQRRMERLAVAEAERLAQDCVAAGHARLSEHATAAVCGPLREGGAEQMLLNGSYLVDNRHQEAFLAELDRLAAEHAPLGLRYELGGPWPGYHFC